VEKLGVIVVKLGGSLFTEPLLGPTLRQWLITLSEPVVIFPGGGSFADVVRELDSVHKFSSSESHWLAIRSLSLSTFFLQQLLGSQLDILDAYEFFTKHDITPHSWTVTSDSLSLAYAQHQQASKLVLLKSITKPDEASWEQAANLELVDRYFPTLHEQNPIPVELINFRAWL
jgi:aspartokinase-like uncharacterized kinase